jgi:hypothetical protein
MPEPKKEPVKRWVCRAGADFPLPRKRNFYKKTARGKFTGFSVPGE